jgi:hypothetical protein
MRRLTLLPCPESWDRMRPDGDGRHCEQCSLRVTELARLDGGGVDELLAQAEHGRACARVELEGGRPRTATGLAAGVLIAVLASGCATTVSSGGVGVDLERQRADEIAYFDSQVSPEDEGGVIAGFVRYPEGAPQPNALVVLMSTALDGQQERMTDARGFYAFKNLPPGKYTIQVLSGSANVSKITTLDENARFRANFAIDPDENQPEIMLGMISLEPTLGTSPASSYSSRMIEYQ